MPSVNPVRARRGAAADRHGAGPRSGSGECLVGLHVKDYFTLMQVEKHFTFTTTVVFLSQGSG